MDTGPEAVENLRHIKLILRVLKQTKRTVTFKIEQQTLIDDPTNTFNSDEFETSILYDEEDYGVYLISDLDSPRLFVDGGYKLLHVRGPDVASYNDPVTCTHHQWKLIKKVILAYNQEHSQNTLTEEDVIWT